MPQEITMFDRDREFALKGGRLLSQRRRSLYLSLLLPGLGQIYQGRRLAGTAILLIFLFPFYYLYLIGELLSYGGLSLIGAQLLLYALQAYDALKGARRESSPCEDFCPAGVNVPSFMAYCEEGDFEGAYASFLTRAPFPFTLGEICPASCEEKCGILPERPLRIREVHREFAKRLLEEIEIEEREPFFPLTGKRVAVVGGGVAGLTVAYYLASCGVEVELFEREEELGGTLRYVPPFKLNRELFKREIELITSFKNLKVSLGADIRERPKGFDLVVTAVGSLVERRFPHEDGRVIYPLEFLKSPPELKGKRVAVVGAGDTAFDVARLTVRLGGEAEIFYRGEAERIRAGKKEVEAAVREGVKIYTGCRFEEFLEGGAQFTCGRADFDYLVPALGFEVDRELVEAINGDFITGDALYGMTTAVEAVGRARGTAHAVLKELGLSDRAWFTVDFYKAKPQKPSGSNLFIVSESSLCQHCGVKVKS